MVTILGHQYKFRELDPLAGRYYADFPNLNDVAELFERLFEAGAKPLYATNREVHLKSGMTTATVRVYFVSKDVPDALVVNNAVANQVVFNKRLYFMNGKDAAPPASRPRFGQRSEHCVDLDLNKSSKRTGESQDLPAESDSDSSDEDDNERRSDDADMSLGSSSTWDEVQSTKSMEVEDDGNKSSSEDESMEKSTPVESESVPKNTPTEEFKTVRSKKRRFFEEDQDQQVAAPNPIATADWTSSNFYADLAEVWGSYEVQDFSGDDSPTTNTLGVFQLTPTLASVGEQSSPAKVAPSA